MSQSLSNEIVLASLKKVKYPGLSRDIVSFGMVKDLRILNGAVSFTLTPSTNNEEIKAQIVREAHAAVKALDGVTEVSITLPEPEITQQSEEAPTNQPGGIEPPKKIEGVKQIVAVASGKGGVGKSTVSVNLAVALAQLGAKVGLLDADIYGPSIPTMMGVHEEPFIENNKLIPLDRYGVKMISIGFLVPQERALIWRGPMVMSAVQQLLRDVAWGELDVLVVDLPPGTGDAQLTLAQQVPLTGAVVVTTPQDVALIDATKGVAMFQEMNVPILGIIENMSYFICPHCGERTDIFSHGGGKSASERLEVPFLGEIPINTDIRVGGDEGKPAILADPESVQSKVFSEIARKLLS